METRTVTRLLQRALPLLLLLAMTMQPKGMAASKEPVRATVLLITHDALKDAWKPFADWKTKNGKATRIVTVSEIGKEYKGRDIQEKIRACVLVHIDKHSTRWVILGGDSSPDSTKLVPDRGTPHPALGREHIAIPTDIYYISRANWDANEDGVYGDWFKDREAVDYTNPKACIARIPLRSVEDVKAYTAKVIAFESTSPRSGSSSMVYTSPIAATYPKLNTSKKIVTASWPAGTVSQFFADKTPWDKERPGDHELSVPNWIKLINSGTVEKMHMHGHGFIQNWALEGHAGVGLRDVAKLKNHDSPLFLSTVSCFTGEFDSKTDPSIAEAMLRHARGGALVMIAPSREGRPIFHDPRRDIPLMVRNGKLDGTTETMTLFWKYALESDRTVGEAFSLVKQHFSADAQKHPGYHFLQCEVNLLGDPTLSLGVRASAK